MENTDFLAQLEAGFSSMVVDPLSAVIFFDVAFFSDSILVPLVVLWLILGASWFTLRLDESMTTLEVLMEVYP